MIPATLRTETIELKLKTPFRLSRGTSAVRHNVIATVEAGGFVGQGEAAPIPRYGETAASATDALLAMAEKISAPAAFSEEAARVAIPGQRAAQAALDAALHDLAGRRFGVPVRELLGLGRRPLAPTSWTIGNDPIDEALAKVAAAGQFEVLKVKMGLPGDLELLRAIRESTRQTIRVDANEGWTLEDAHERLTELAKLDVEFVEQPLPAGNLEETRALRARSPLPFVADEDVHDARDVHRLVGAYDGINVKLAKCGGIAPAIELIAVARAHGLKVLLGCMIESSLGIAAALAVASLVDWIDLDGHLLTANDPYAGLGFHEGRLVAPDAPGLGVARIVRG